VARRPASRQGAAVAQRGEIYLISLDPTHGHEQQGRRPVLVVSPGAFNRLTKVPIVLPITTGGDFARARGFAVSLAGAGTRTIGVVRCDQPCAIDLDARGGRGLESVPVTIIDEVLARLAPLFD
jgi:mRNA-degrading endonuclease toxin of MazEF toxin-antitoxin module